jgi:hypothetical protein
MEETDLEHLAGHDRLTAAGPVEVSHDLTPAGHSAPGQGIAEFSENRVGVLQESRAVDPVAAGAQVLGHDDRKLTPAG